MTCDMVQCYWNSNGMCHAEDDPRPSFCPIEVRE